ncbi:MAG: PIN domain-containing protein [Oscillatoria sp. SIO1A7]|nr:PIN domain-containing protein [Oscillatoria sp. SIO1A7]
MFKATLRDTLLRAAEAKLYEVYWSETILDEVSRNLVSTGRTSAEQAERLLAAMRQFFSEATVTGFEYLIPSMTNDEKDRHVLAAAVKAEADAIVTSNIKDFPDRALAPFRIKRLSPDQFLVYLFNENPEAMTRIVAQQATQLRRPPIAVKEILDVLAADAPQFVALVRPRLNPSEQ